MELAVMNVLVLEERDDVEPALPLLADLPAHKPPNLVCVFLARSGVTLRRVAPDAGAAPPPHRNQPDRKSRTPLHKRGALDAGFSCTMGPARRHPAG